MHAFELIGVVHLVRPTGVRAHDLDSLLSGLDRAPDSALFYHVVHPRLRHAVAAETPPDDLSHWVGAVLQDAETAERLSFAAQHHGDSAAELRAALRDALRAVPEEARVARRAPEGGEFQFLSAESVAVPDTLAAETPAALFESLARADASVWFYHLLERPWFGDRALFDWLAARGERRLAGWLEDAARSGLPLERARRGVVQRWRRSRLGQATLEAAAQAPDARRERESQAVSNLVRLLRPARERGA
jgi:hypothetical protein